MLPGHSRRGGWWLAALLLPWLVLAMGFANISPRPGGMDFPELALAWQAAITAALAALGLSAISLYRREANRFWSLLTGLPGALLVMGALGWWVAHRAAWI